MTYKVVLKSANCEENTNKIGKPWLFICHVPPFASSVSTFFIHHLWEHHLIRAWSWMPMTLKLQGLHWTGKIYTENLQVVCKPTWLLCVCYRYQRWWRHTWMSQGWKWAQPRWTNCALVLNKAPLWKRLMPSILCWPVLQVWPSKRTQSQARGTSSVPGCMMEDTLDLRVTIVNTLCDKCCDTILCIGQNSCDFIITCKQHLSLCYDACMCGPPSVLLW